MGMSVARLKAATVSRMGTGRLRNCCRMFSCEAISAPTAATKPSIARRPLMSSGACVGCRLACWTRRPGATRRGAAARAPRRRASRGGRRAWPCERARGGQEGCSMAKEVTEWPGRALGGQWPSVSGHPPARPAPRPPRRARCHIGRRLTTHLPCWAAITTLDRACGWECMGLAMPRPATCRASSATARIAFESIFTRGCQMSPSKRLDASPALACQA